RRGHVHPLAHRQIQVRARRGPVHHHPVVGDQVGNGEHRVVTPPVHPQRRPHPQGFAFRVFEQSPQRGHRIGQSLHRGTGGKPPLLHTEVLTQVLLSGKRQRSHRLQLER